MQRAVLFRPRMADHAASPPVASRRRPQAPSWSLAWIIREGAQDFGLGGAVARFFVASVTR